MRRIQKKLTDSSARGLLLCFKRSGKFLVVVTEGDSFFSAPELQTDGFNVAWSGVVDVNNACVDFLSKKKLLASFQRAEVSFERPGLFDIVRYEREGERRLLVIGRRGVVAF